MNKKYFMAIYFNLKIGDNIKLEIFKSEIKMNGDIIIFDTETTGLLMPSAADLFSQPFLVEFYGIRVDKEWNVIDEFETFAKPPIPIPEDSIRVHNITDEMVSDAPSFIQIADRLIEFFFGVEIAVAHNATYDMGVLLHELERYDLQYKFPWPPKQHCTVEISKPIKNKMLNLDTLYEIATGKPRSGIAHRAKQDVIDLARCYKWLTEQGFVK
jgi:DNA polymerase III epsilon subunit-like protein